jgi:hypothetical protein
VRAAHLAACNAAPYSAAGADKRLPTYHFTHACLRDTVASALREAGIYTQTEVAGMMEGQTRPGDVVGWTATQTLVLDVTVTHLLTPSNVNDGERAPGRSTSADEKHKRDKYEGECRARGYEFVPFAVDDFGHLGDSAQSFLEQLAARAAVSRTGDFREGSDEAARRAYWLRTWHARIAWAVHRGIELSLERRMQLSADVDIGTRG